MALTPIRRRRSRVALRTYQSWLQHQLVMMTVRTLAAGELTESAVRGAFDAQTAEEIVTVARLLKLDAARPGNGRPDDHAKGV